MWEDLIAKVSIFKKLLNDLRNAKKFLISVEIIDFLSVIFPFNPQMENSIHFFSSSARKVGNQLARVRSNGSILMTYDYTSSPNFPAPEMVISSLERGDCDHKLVWEVR